MQALRIGLLHETQKQRILMENFYWAESFSVVRFHFYRNLSQFLTLHSLSHSNLYFFPVDLLVYFNFNDKISIFQNRFRVYVVE